MRISELLKTEGLLPTQPPALTCGQTVENAARRMERFGSRALPICRRDGTLAGVITERDIVVKVVAHARAPELCTVDEVMTTRFLSCFADDPVETLHRLFSAEGGDCAVVRQANGQFVAIVERESLWRRAPPARERPALAAR